MIIPTHKNPDRLKALLHSIDFAIRNAEKSSLFLIEIEILVVSNFNDELAAQVASEFKRVKFFHGNVLGVNSARNLGLQHAKYEYFYFFDDDCLIIEPDFFQILMQEMMNLPSNKWFVGGFYKKTESAKLFDRVYSEIQSQWLLSGILNSQNHCGYLLGGNFGGFTVGLKKHGFDPKIIFGGSETEMFLRLARIGYSCQLSKQLNLGHQTQLKAWHLILKALKQGRGAAYLVKKGLDFESPYFISHKISLTQPSEIVWYRIYRLVFQLSCFVYLPATQQFSNIKKRILLLVMKPELWRKNVTSRIVALIDVHLNSKK